jgi:bifunctional DNase/RNase
MKQGTEPLAETTEVEMQIRGLMMDPVTNMPIVVLKDVASDLILPIWVGVFEANAIALELEKSATPRPMTHDLLKNLAHGLNARVNKVVVSELKDDTFYALIWMEQGGEVIALDSRPSDAIALALRWDCPIYVHRDVLNHARQAIDSSPTVSTDQLRSWLENLNDDDMGRYKM